MHQYSNRTISNEHVSCHSVYCKAVSCTHLHTYSHHAIHLECHAKRFGVEGVSWGGGVMWCVCFVCACACVCLCLCVCSREMMKMLHLPIHR